MRGDWLHTNGLAYSAADESIIVSGRHQGVAKIRRDGTLVWLLAPHKGWKAPQSAKLLTAVSASGAPYAESVQLGTRPQAIRRHRSSIGPLVSTRQPCCPTATCSCSTTAPAAIGGGLRSFSRAVIYRIDEAAMTVRQIAQFVLSKSESSCFVSNTHLLPVTGNIFIQPGSTYFDTSGNLAVVKEVATQIADDGTIAFDSVVFDATLDMSVARAGFFAYSYRGHRWTF